MKIVWSLFAISDREAIFDYIEADSPRAAARIDDQIEAQVDQLTTFPESGRPKPGRSLRNWMASSACTAFLRFRKSGACTPRSLVIIKSPQ